MRTFALCACLSVSVAAQDCDPVLLSSIKGPSQDVASTGDIGVISMFELGMRFVDISDPSEPEILSDFLTVNSAFCVAASDSIVFVGADNAFYPMPFLQSVDISDPTEPISLTAIELGMSPFGVAIDHHLLAVSMGNNDQNPDHVRLYDVSDPSSLDIQSIIEIERGVGRLVVRDDLLYLGIPHALLIYDVSDSRNPQLLGRNDDVLGVFRFDYYDGYIFLAGNEFGMQIVDVRDPTNPQLITTLDLPGDATDVTVKNGTAYASYSGGPGGIAAIDINDPFNPTIRGTLDLPTRTHSIALADNNTLLVSTISGVTHLVDITPCDTCPADLTGSSDPDEATYGVPDGDADSDDFFFYLDAFVSADLTTCDIDGDTDCDAKDFFAYLDLFAAGC